MFASFRVKQADAYFNATSRVMEAMDTNNKHPVKNLVDEIGDKRNEPYSYFMKACKSITIAS